MSNAPAQEIRLGLIRASIWKNAAEHGIRYSIVFTKLYKAAGRWQDTGHFCRDDLPLVSKIAELAHDWILEQPQKLILPAILEQLQDLSEAAPASGQEDRDVGPRPTANAA